MDRVEQPGLDLIAFRRDLHAHPELSHREERTTEVVLHQLERAGVRARRLPGTGLVADLGAEQPAYRVALRADIDALPVPEVTGLPWASTVHGVCHACGHDVHTTVVLGAGLALAHHEPALVEMGVGVRLIFQPAEEVIPGGAHEVMEAGGLDGVDRILTVHCDPTIDVGEVGLKVGPVTAASDAVEVTLNGRGGHTSRPHLTQDLTYALAKVVTDVPAALSRRIDPRAGVALVWGSVHAGGAQNVIPATGTVSGTLRMLDVQAWNTAGALLEQIIHAVVLPYGVTATVRHVQGVPPVLNDAAAIDALRAGVLGGGAVETTTLQSLGGEDFGWYLTQVSGALARLGTRTPGGPTFDLHMGDVIIDERAVGIGVRVLTQATLWSAREARSGQDTPEPRPRRDSVGIVAPR
ncbi:amidohydrolase [Lapillicoccus sp.]|uniref:amidohydrolase n=1 Tax=Lapillicoccus sp. TaxID=1909287 RepID=UPI003267666D